MATVANLVIKITAATSEFTKALSGVEKQWSRTGKRLQSTGADLTKGLTLPILAVGGAAVKAAMDFETSFAGVRKTVNATQAEYNRLAQGMRDLAKTKPVDVNQLNRIGEMAGQLGVSKDHIVEFTGVVADLTVATNLTADQAGNAMARIANVMQMPLSNVNRMGSAIVALGNFGAATEGEMLDFATRIAGAGAVAGLTVPNILAIGNAFSSSGIEAEAGGTAIQKALLSMTEAVTTGKHLPEFGAIAGTGAAGFKTLFNQDPAEAFTRFVEGIGKAGRQAIPLLQSIGFENQRMIRAFLSMSNAGDLLRRSIEVGNDAWTQNTALTRAAEQRYQTFANQLQLTWNRLKDVAITLGNAMIPALKDFVNVAAPMAKHLEDFAQWFSQLHEPVRKTAIGFGLFLASLGPMSYAMGTMMRGAAAFTKFWMDLPGAMRATAAAFKLLPFMMTPEGLILSATIVLTPIALKGLQRSNEENIDAGVMMGGGGEMPIPLGPTRRQLMTSIFGKPGAGAPAGLSVGVSSAVAERAAAGLGPQIDPAATKAMEKWTAAVQKYREQFSGADLIYDTNAMVTAINQMGGASKLTKDEFERFSKNVGEAVEKMRAMGDPDIPRSWQVLKSSIDNTNNALETTKVLGEQLKEAMERSPQLLQALTPVTSELDAERTRDLLYRNQPGVLNPDKAIRAAETAGERMASAFIEKFNNAFSSLPELLVRSMLHSGGLKNAWKAFGVEMADAFIEPFIKELIKKLALEKLGQKIATAIFGKDGGGGGGSSNPYAFAAQMAGGILLGGQQGGGAGGSMFGGLGLNKGAGKAGHSLLDVLSNPYVGGPLAGAAAGLGIGYATGSKTLGALAGAGAGAGVGFMLGGPVGALVGGAAGFVAGLFGGHLGAGHKANTNRDKFLAQFAGFDYKRDPANPPGFYGLSALLTKYKHHELFDQLVGAHNPGSVKKAEQSIAAFMQTLGRSVHVYHAGGMVPGTGDVPAILQGGERVLNRQEAAGYGGSVTFNIYAWDGVDCERAVRRSIPYLKRHMILNTDDLLTVTRREIHAQG